MATKRVKRAPGRTGISAAALEAWRVGDWHGANRACGIKSWQVSPFDAGPEPPIGDPRLPYTSSWPRAREFRAALIAVAGEPGGVGRHGEPLGPGVPDYVDEECEP